MGPSGMKAYAISTQRHETTATEPYVSAKVGSISFAIVCVGALAVCNLSRRGDVVGDLSPISEIIRSKWLCRMPVGRLKSQTL